MSEGLPDIDPGFSTESMTALFSQESRLEAMCRVEAALAMAQDSLGITPSGVAAEIEKACGSVEIDTAKTLGEGWELGSPVMALLEKINENLTEEAAKWLHHGATTQDIVDTANSLLIRDGLAEMRAGLVSLARSLADLTSAHRDTPMLARTFLQDAGPTTFGLRCAQWLSPFLEHLGEIDRTRPTVQLGGPNGTASSHGPMAGELTAALAERLGLGVPLLPWHTDRSEIHREVALVLRIATSARKAATDIVLLSQSAVGEIRVRAGGSSSMDWKRNPIDAIRAIAAAEVCAANAALVLTGPAHELERGFGAWHAEWFAIPVVFQTAASAIEGLRRSVETLEVDTARMESNLGEMVGDVSSAGRLVDDVLAETSRALDRD